MTCDRCHKPIPAGEEIPAKHWYGREYEDVVVCPDCNDAIEREAAMTAFDEEYERERSRGWAD